MQANRLKLVQPLMWWVMGMEYKLLPYPCRAIEKHAKCLLNFVHYMSQTRHLELAACLLSSNIFAKASDF